MYISAEIFSSVATGVHDSAISDSLLKFHTWITEERAKQEAKHSNLPGGMDDEDEGLDIEGAGADVPVVGENEEEGEEEGEGGEGEEEGGGGETDPNSEDDKRPRKRARMSRMSADAQIVQTGMHLDFGRISRSGSHYSNSSCASSCASSVASSVVSISDSAVSDSSD